MPVKLERALKRKASKLGLGKKRSDAYVYGTLRKTGWKPSREKKMDNPSRVVRLAQINNAIEFDDEARRRRLEELAGGAAGIATGIPAGTLATKFIGNRNAFLERVLASEHPERWIKGLGYTGMGTGIAAGMLTARTIRKQFERDRQQRAARELSSKKKPIEFADLPIANKDILQPWQAGEEQGSKLYEVQFPAGLSPAAALRLPLPQLMAFLNQRNILQQQFSKRERLIRLSAKLDEINASAHPTQ